jgi:glycosyltransferase involved in cell wall biosynthesis
MPQHILLAAGREASYIRNHLLLSAARSCAAVTAITPARPGSLSLNLLHVLRRLLPALRQPHDLVILGFYAHPLVPIVRRFTRAPILFDAFVSTWDTLCFDRQKFAPTSLPGRSARWFDLTACHAADHVLLDTRTHARFFIDSFKLDPDRVSSWYVGCDETIFYPRPQPQCTAHEPLTVFFYGTYQPLHGVDVILQAAALVKDDPRLHFKLIGDGQTAVLAHRLARQQQLNNVEFLAPVPLAELATHIAASDICLGGPFGATAKAQRVIPGKTAQFLAMARPVVATATPANNELLVHGQSAYLCRSADPHALAVALQTLADDASLRATLAQRGYELFKHRLSLTRLTADLCPVIDQMLHLRSTASSRSTHASH